MKAKYIDLKNITKNASDYADELKNLVEKLDDEKQFFNLKYDRIENLKLVAIARNENGEIIGVAGIEKKLCISRSIMMILGKYHGKGIGKAFMLFLLNEAKLYKYHLIMGVVDENNIGALKMDYSTGYRYCGKRGKLVYIFNPLSKFGKVLFFIIKTGFPIINCIDDTIQK